MVIRHNKENAQSPATDLSVNSAGMLDDTSVAQIAKSMFDQAKQQEDMIPDGYEGTLTFIDENGTKQTVPTEALGAAVIDQHTKGRVWLLIGSVAVATTVAVLAGRKAWRMRQKPQ